MARPREFDPNTILDAAIDLFWRKGYKACSMADVVKQSGVARYGLYQTFKDKDQLYCATLCRYRQVIANLFLKQFCCKDKQADYQTLTEHFEQMLSELEKGEYKGCFAHQAAIERASEDPEVNEIVQSFFAEVKGHYRELLKRSIKNGEVRDMPLEDLVIYLMGIQRAVTAMSKQNCTVQERRDYVRCSLALLKP